MGNKNYKAVIVEGEMREPQIINNIFKVHFRNCNFKLITLPAGENIYMLWKRMKEDDFETDIIEVLRESSDEIKEILAGLERDDFSEVFLFFDYDGHQQNLRNNEEESDVLEEMLVNFDNETENGKLYISYPMVEALRGFIPEQCSLTKDCFSKISEFNEYKKQSGECSQYTKIGKYDFEMWKTILNVFAMRVSCLWDEKVVFEYKDYQNDVSPHTIYKKQKEFIENGEVFILSAFPEFLLDYFQVKFWNANIIYRQLRKDGCKHRRD